MDVIHKWLMQWVFLIKCFELKLESLQTLWTEANFQKLFHCPNTYRPNCIKCILNVSDYANGWKATGSYIFMNLNIFIYIYQKKRELSQACQYMHQRILKKKKNSVNILIYLQCIQGQAIYAFTKYLNNITASTRSLIQNSL